MVELETGYADLCNVEAEHALVGAALIRGGEIFSEPLVARLLPSHFMDDKAQDAWQEILAQRDSFDIVTISDGLRARDTQVDYFWLHSMVDACVSAFNAKKYAQIVWDYARKRRAHQIISQIGAAIFNNTFEDALDEGIRDLARVRDARIEG